MSAALKLTDWTRPVVDVVKLDLTGQRFGRLLVIEEAPTRVSPKGLRVRYWACRCDCGNHAERSTGQLRSRGIYSCGCAIGDAAAYRNFRHGAATGPTRTPEYIAWKAMRQRCDAREGSRDYHLYAARGVSVCERWNDFSSFLADMGTRPSSQHSIDRVNPDGNYEPSNCRWADKRQQANNRRSTRVVTYRGEEMPLGDYCRVTGIPYKRAYFQIAKMGLTGDSLASKVLR